MLFDVSLTMRNRRRTQSQKVANRPRATRANRTPNPSSKRKEPPSASRGRWTPPAPPTRRSATTTCSSWRRT
jgi:hypothetical protein